MFFLTQSTQRARRRKAREGTAGEPRKPRQKASRRENRKKGKHLGDGYFFVGAEDLAEGFADFTEGGVGFYGSIDGRH
jgi:hypothetical protein